MTEITEEGLEEMTGEIKETLGEAVEDMKENTKGRHHGSPQISASHGASKSIKEARESHMQKKSVTINGSFSTMKEKDTEASKVREGLGSLFDDSDKTSTGAYSICGHCGKSTLETVDGLDDDEYCCIDCLQEEYNDE